MEEDGGHQGKRNIDAEVSDVLSGIQDEDDFLLDIDIYHMSHTTELLHYIDAKYLSRDLSGTNPVDVDTWIDVQQHVDCFTITATQLARRLAAFVKVLDQEDISQLDDYELIKEVS